MEQDRLENCLRASGLRVTPQRRAVWDAFDKGAGRHLTAKEVFERARRELPGIARATVYNSLPELVRAGLLRTIESRGAVLYDPDLDPEHQHFRCQYCERLYDVRVEGVETLRIPGRRFVVEWKTVLLEGLCPDCSRTQAYRS